MTAPPPPPARAVPCGAWPSWRSAGLADVAKLADIDGMEPEGAADEWLAENEAKWKGRVKGSGS